MLPLQIGASALRAQQQVLATLSQNISQADTPGYSRLRLPLEQRIGVASGQFGLGHGVSAGTVQRLSDARLQAASTVNSSRLSAVAVQREVAVDLESLLAPGPASLHGVTSRFAAAHARLAADPESLELRQEFLAQGSELAAALNRTEQELRRMQEVLNQRIGDSVQEVNRISRELRETYRQLRGFPENPPPGLLDQRDLLIDQLANLVDVDPQSVAQGGPPLVGAGGALLVGSTATTLRVVTNTNGELRVHSELGESRNPSGQLGGLLMAREMLREYQTAFRDWSLSTMRYVDQFQSTGPNWTASGETLRSARRVSDVDQPLSQAGLPYPLSGGQLWLTVRDLSAGTQQVKLLEVDPEADTLRTLATKLEQFPGLNAWVNAEQGTLHLQPQSGISISFSAHLPTHPEPEIWTGTSSVTLSGVWTGANNSRWELEILQGGRVGLDADVEVLVREAGSGTEIRRIKLGPEAPLNTPLPLGEGVFASFGLGELVTGDRLSWPVVAQPDEAGVLAALGLGSFFAGSAENGWSLHPELSIHQLNPADRSSSGDSATTSFGLAALEEIIIQTGYEVSTWQRLYTLHENQQQELTTRRAAISGVNPEEEFVLLLMHQRSFQAASRLIVSVNETLGEVLNLIR